MAQQGKDRSYWIEFGKRAAEKKLRNFEGSIIAAIKLIGRVVDGMYPANNSWGVRLRMERRRVLVKQVFPEGAPDEVVRRDPLVRRLGVLVIAHDLDKDAERSFYLGCFKHRKIMSLKRAMRTDPRPACAFLIPKPMGWKPKKPTDLPPGVVVHAAANPRFAETFARHFNKHEMKIPSGKWAVAGHVQAHVQANDDENKKRF